MSDNEEHGQDLSDTGITQEEVFKLCGVPKGEHKRITNGWEQFNQNLGNSVAEGFRLIAEKQKKEEEDDTKH